nr:MAG TPA: YopX protein [Caudoviricetes sp.]
MIRFRAWHNTWEEMSEVKRIRFDDEGNVTTVLFIGKDLGVNAKIDEIELMQSTGLFDENDKEIFDGDILKVKIMSGQSWLETVRYNDEKAMFVSKEVKRKVLESPLYDLFITDLLEVEVIGNIYENPELVEVEI